MGLLVGLDCRLALSGCGWAGVLRLRVPNKGATPGCLNGCETLWSSGPIHSDPLAASSLTLTLGKG